jgi:membrane protease YdiL (CAAX protease family)
MLRCLLPVRQALLHAQPIQGNLLTARQTLSMEGAGIVGLIVATWLLARLERRRITSYGLARRGGVGYFFRGLVWGVALLSLLVFLLRAFGLLVFDARLLSGAAIARYALLWLAGFLLVALKEELFSRGYLQFTLTRGLRSVYRWLFGARYSNALGFWTAAAALSYLFGAGHSTNPDESPLGLVSAGLAGLLFCLSLWRTGSLWWAIGLHATWDWSESFLFGAADSGLVAQGNLLTSQATGPVWLSGGTVGPEASVLVFPALAVLALIAWRGLPAAARQRPARAT